MEMLAIFDDLKSASAAVQSLVDAGFAESSVTSLTSVPYPNGVLVHTEEHSWFRWLTLAGAVVGAISGFALAAGTAWLYPVRTGDKAIIALFPTGIITYEITMLFAIVATMAGMFLEMGLPPRRPLLYDEAISEGCIGIGVVAADESEARKAQDILKDAGALRVATEASL